MDASPVAGPRVAWTAIEVARVASMLGGVMPKRSDVDAVGQRPPNLLVLGASGHVPELHPRFVGAGEQVVI
jgi:hypothetical protein